MINLSNIFACCHNCEKRELGCHSCCEEYITAKENLDKIKESLVDPSEIYLRKTFYQRLNISSAYNYQYNDIN